MCGRYVLASSKADYEKALAKAGITFNSERGPPSIPPDYNVTPSKAVWISRHDGKNAWLEPVMWGLVPRWSKDKDDGPRPINARAETVATNRLFAPLLKSKRCLVPCDGYYEWKTTPSGKQPYFIRLKSGEPFFMAGLYDVWHEGKTDALATFTTITCRPNETLADIHDRMPVIVKPADYTRWLDPMITDPEALKDILAPYPADEMTAYPVSKRVNSPRNNDPGLIDPMN